MKYTESTEAILIYRDEKNDVAGLLIRDAPEGEPIFSGYLRTSYGFTWVVREKEYRLALERMRELYFWHTHKCPSCHLEVECRQHQRCPAPQDDKLCGDCQGDPPDAHLEAAFEERFELTD
jgi:hypothetical protein